MKNNKKRKLPTMAKSNVFIGKDVIELVGNAMYLEPLTVYREYIQNSVDAVDDAIRAGLLDTPAGAQIDIAADGINRKIVIRDNGIGIPDSEFLDRMLSLGGSTKRHMSARGFRGVGRLAGLGFCQDLIFRSRAKGGKFCQLSWDVGMMKTALAEQQGDGDIADLIREVTKSEVLESSEFPDHFFEVELKRPLRLGQDILVNFEKIRSYVGQVGPVPFSPSFSFADQIRDFLKSAIDFREYPIFLNDGSGQIFKPHEDRIRYTDIKIGHLRDIDFFELSSLHGENGAVGWLLDHDYQGTIPKSAGVGGLRARIGNLQIGDRSVFVDAFPEDGFNSWSVGEVHVFDKGLVPNGRRDGFQHGNHLANLKSQLLPIGHKVAQRCRRESFLRNQSKRVELALLDAQTIADILDQKAVSKSAAKLQISKARGKLSEARSAYDPKTFRNNGGRNVLAKMKRLEKHFSNAIARSKKADPLGHLPKGKRAAYKEVFELIYACSNNQHSAKILIDNILNRL